MIRSMTGFGRCEIADEKCKITVEIKSVNHRYLDVNIKMPKKLNSFEGAIRKLLKEYAERGKIDLYISYETYTKDKVFLKYNRELAAQYVSYLKTMSEQLGIENDISASTLARFPEVFVMDEQNPDEEELWFILERVVRGAIEQLVENRIAEGERLQIDLLEKLDSILSCVVFIEEYAPLTLKAYRERLDEKVRELLMDRQLDEARIASEVAIFADKVCVDEETVRLRSHVESMKSALCVEGGIGRKLDFIAQEMNREANTILSKTNNIKISDVGISLKTDIEKVREQIQNIE